MPSKNKLERFILDSFYKDYDTDETELNENPHMFFRYLCYKNNYFLKQIPLPCIKKNNIYEAVFIEFRVFPHVEFLIRNAILQLGKDWSFTIVCGNDNYDMMSNMAINISENMKVIKFDIDNLNQSEYSDFLTKPLFWETLYGEKILIYQEDSIIFKNNIKDFLSWDYIGAPFPKTENDTPNSVGNGGFSLRDKSLMLDIIKKYPINTCFFNDSTLRYMKKLNLKTPPEDVYFSKTIQEFNLGKVADWESSFKFSSESVLNKNSFAGHKFWISNSEWVDSFNKIYKLKLYESNNNIIEYLKYYNLPVDFNKTITIKNAFDIDFYFMSKANNFQYKNNLDLLKNVKNIEILDGMIYHPKQLKNLYPEIDIYSFNNNLYVSFKLSIYLLSDFVKNYVYKLSYKNLCSLLIKNKYYNLNNNIN